jgi:hypothetical protein
MKVPLDDNNVDAELEGLARYQLLNRIGEGSFGMVRPSHVTEVSPRYHTVWGRRNWVRRVVQVLVSIPEQWSGPGPPMR